MSQEEEPPSPVSRRLSKKDTREIQDLHRQVAELQREIAEKTMQLGDTSADRSVGDRDARLGEGDVGDQDGTWLGEPEVRLRSSEAEALDDAKHGVGFEVDTLFLLGSPVGLFLRLRRISLAAHVLPKVRQVFNIYHPSDLVAYRIEPFVHRSYAQVLPRMVPDYTIPIANMENTPRTTEPRVGIEKETEKGVISRSGSSSRARSDSKEQSTLLSYFGLSTAVGDDEDKKNEVEEEVKVEIGEGEAPHGRIEDGMRPPTNLYPNPNPNPNLNHNHNLNPNPNPNPNLNLSPNAHLNPNPSSNPNPNPNWRTLRFHPEAWIDLRGAR